MDETINSAYSDLSPMPMGDTALIYAQLRSDTVPVVKGSGQKKKYLISLQQAVKKGKSWVPQGKMVGPFNDDKMHTANGTFSPNGRRFFFVRCEENKSYEIICSIYFSEFNDSTWEEPVLLNEIINKPGSNNTQPAVGYDKKRNEVLYWVSDRIGGRGGKDIWYAVFNPKLKAYTRAYNARKVINTPGDEVTPFYDTENLMLYFSSDGHPGMGGYDVFSSDGMLKKWTKPVNIGYPINSRVDDMYYVLQKDNEHGFLVSNRIGSIALKSETCCDDIYSFRWLNIFRFAIRGIVLDEDDSTRTPIKDAAVELSVIDTETGEDIFVKSDTTKDGKLFFFTLGKNKSYKLLGAKEDFFSGRTTASTVGLTKSDTLDAIIYIKKREDKSYALRNIYYDFDKTTLRSESLPNIDTLKMLLVDNPLIIVEIGSHTDSRGSPQYNLTLSEGRAKSVVLYLAKSGIPIERMEAKGYGEGLQLEDCSIYPECPETAEGDCPCHQKNRRTEFKVIGELDGPIEYDDEYYDDEEEFDNEEGDIDGSD